MNTRLALAALPLAFALACSDSYKARAEVALQTAQTTIDTLSDVAVRWAPAQRRELEKALAEAQAAAARKDYKAALAAAQAIPEKAKQVLATANANKEQAGRWHEKSFTLERMIDALKRRLNDVSPPHPLPAGVEQRAVDQVRAGLAAREAGLAAARVQAEGGELGAALAKVTELQDQVTADMKSLGML